MKIEHAAHVAEMSKRLQKLYLEAHVELDYTNAFELMVASILAAQNRDTTINKITAVLFRKYHGPADYIAAPILTVLIEPQRQVRPAFSFDNVITGDTDTIRILSRFYRF